MTVRAPSASTRARDGELPGVEWVIPVDEHGTLASVTNVWPDEPPLIRAEVVDYTLDSLSEQAEEIQRHSLAEEAKTARVSGCLLGASVPGSD